MTYCYDITSLYFHVILWRFVALVDLWVGLFFALARNLIILILYLAFDGICLHLIRGGVYIVLVL